MTTPQIPPVVLTRVPDPRPTEEGDLLVAHVVLGVVRRGGVGPAAQPLASASSAAAVPLPAAMPAAASMAAQAPRAPAGALATLPTPAPAASGIAIDRDQRIAWVDGLEIELTYLQFELLDALISQPGRVFRREQLIAAVWGYAGYASGRTVDVHIARLRRRLGPAYRHCIVTVRGAGYKYLPPTLS